MVSLLNLLLQLLEDGYVVISVPATDPEMKVTIGDRARIFSFLHTSARMTWIVVSLELELWIHTLETELGLLGNLVSGLGGHADEARTPGGVVGVVIAVDLIGVSLPL